MSRDWAGTVLTMAKHLTPDERAAIVARYQEIANARAVAAEFGVSEYTVRTSVNRAGTAEKNALHARAVARAVREARRSLARKVHTIDLYLLKHAKNNDGVPDLEPRDVAALVNASAGVLSKLLEADARIEQKKLSRLTRDLRRKEIELAALKIAAGGVEKHEHSINASVVVLPELDADGSVAAEPRPADAVSGE